MLVPELGDQFFVHGCEFKTESAANQSAETTITRAKRRAKQSKQKTIGAIAKKMLEVALDEVGLKPDGTLKEGYEAQTGIMTDQNFRVGVLMLLKTVNHLVQLMSFTQLKSMHGVTDVQQDP